MPTWGGILQELDKSTPEGQRPDFDAIRRKYLAAVFEKTNRDVILYASKFTQPDATATPDVTTITDEDIQGLMEVVHGLTGQRLDLILHSPGGSPEAADAFVQYVRSKFDHIRVVVPQMAMSAATMIACASDVIVMGKHSFLGPIDPQIVLHTPLGYRMVPCHAILQQFERAKEECVDPNRLAVWLPMLNQFGPDLLVVCDNLCTLSEMRVREWLEAYMFRSDGNKREKARQIANWLAEHSEHGSHGRHIGRGALEERGLVVERLEEDQEAQDLFLSVFHATTHTFNGTAAVKIIENHAGRAFIKQAGPVLVQGPVPQGILRPPEKV